MTLAGSMKLRNFVMLMIVAVGAAIAVSFVACHGKDEKPKAETKAEVKPLADAPKPTPVDAAAQPTPPAATSDLAARSYDAEVLAWRTKPLTGGKGKDVHKGVAYKINVYQDSGKATVNRVKVDANRNDKFDDKYTFDGDTVTLERAPADDEKYTEKYHWNGTGWTKA